MPADTRLARELLDGLAEAIVTTDHAGIVTLVNAMAVDLLPELTLGTDLARCAVPASTVDEVKVGGMPIGALTAARFLEAEVRLAPGELLLAYTDGVTEARGGPTELEMFGDARLRQALASGAGLPPAALVDRLLQLVDEWLDGQVHDDIAMLAVAAAPG